MESSTVRSVSTASVACRSCARRTEFEQPPCPDGHGQDCPEWYCTECGAATLVGWSLDRRALRRDLRGTSRRRRVA